MTTLMTITDKGQVTLSKALLTALGLSVGDKIAVKVKALDKTAVLKPLGRGILDIMGTLPKFTIPKGKTIDDLIHEAREEAVEKEIR